MTSLGPSAFQLELARIAHAAGTVIMDIYARGFAVENKADQSPVTEADRAAEQLILTHLHQKWPQIPVIAEENNSAGNVPEAAQQFFLVDPLDGTREFISRNGEFTVNIAKVENGAPVAGVVYAPALDSIYVGEAGTGAWRAMMPVDQPFISASWSKVTITPNRPGGPIAIASRSHRDAETDAYLRLHKASNIISRGSSLKFCAIAEGSADLYPRFGRTMEWDTAAGQAVLEAAGGHVRTVEGEPLRYGKAERGYDNPPFIASTA